MKPSLLKYIFNKFIQKCYYFLFLFTPLFLFTLFLVHIHNKCCCILTYFFIFPNSGSTLCTLHMLTPTRPLVLGGNDSITLAPYHTHYPLLNQHMARVGLASHPNLWDQPLCIGMYLNSVITHL